ncbi:MAG: hypothetical protein OXI27_09405 [Thaumarchaeota archaeon]|nr:hypothetical protein [Nitrososphaerota archaeon]
MSYSYTTSSTFTRTDVAYVASKVVADLRAITSYYGQPSESEIQDYYEELVELLAEGCVARIEYGFSRSNKRVFTLSYEVGQDGSLQDGRSGGVPARADVSNAAWYSFLFPSRKWYGLNDAERQRIASRLPFTRTPGKEPQDGDGSWTIGNGYSSRGISTRRSIFSTS